MWSSGLQVRIAPWWFWLAFRPCMSGGWNNQGQIAATTCFYKDSVEITKPIVRCKSMHGALSWSKYIAQSHIRRFCDWVCCRLFLYSVNLSCGSILRRATAGKFAWTISQSADIVLAAAGSMNSCIISARRFPESSRQNAMYSMMVGFRA